MGTQRIDDKHDVTMRPPDKIAPSSLSDLNS